MEFTALGAEMAQLAGRFGSVDAAAAGRADLEWSVRAGRRLRGMIDAREALVTCHLEALIRQGGGLDEPEADVDGGPAAGEGNDQQPGAGDTSSGDAEAAQGGSGGASDTPGGDPAGSGEHRETAEEYAARLARGKWLKRLPLFAAALEAGTITTAHVEALGAVLNHVEATVVADVLADEDALLEVARTGTRASFARYLRLRVDRVRDDGGAGRLKRQINDSFGSLGHDDDLGLHRLFVLLDPIRGEQIYTAIRRRVDQLQQSGAAEGMRRGQVIAQAITDLICGNATAGAGGVEILVIVDLLSLLRGLHDGSICETGDGLAIPVTTVRDLCRRAGATITAAVVGADGVTVAVGQHVGPDDRPGHPNPVSGPDTPSGASGTAPTASTSDDAAPTSDTASTDDIAAMVAAAIGAASSTPLTKGRDIRLANREQRRALRAMYRSCAHPGCRVPFADCFIHHVTPWEHDGLTDLENLLPLCGRHHHQVHEGRWRLTIDAARTLCWYQPGGRLDSQVPFRRLGATAPVHAGGEAAVDTDVDDDLTDPAMRSPDRARSTADTATANAWSRSRGARGSPPTDNGEKELRLFDPTAA